VVVSLGVVELLGDYLSCVLLHTEWGAISLQPLTYLSRVHREKGISMAIASRTPTPNVAEAFMRKLGKPSICRIFAAQT